MKNNLLFVNHNREIIRKFLNAMKEYDLDIDTAGTGDEVAAVLKKKKYKVVITGMTPACHKTQKLPEPHCKSLL